MSAEKKIHLIVPAQSSGVRVDKVLRDLIKDLSRAYIKELIAKGCVNVEGKIIDKPREVVKAGQNIYLNLLAKHEVMPRPVKKPISIIHQDQWIAVINKPPGIATHPNPNSRGDTVADIALKLFGPDLPRGQGEDRPGIVHRLDRDTSGVMVLAKNQLAFDSLTEQFKSRQVEKEYRAIVRGQMRFDSDYIDRPIARHERQRDRMSVSNIGGKESSTFYQVIERFADFTYLRCLPKTGRTHQIRVHLSYLGHSIVGDKVYKVAGANWPIPKDSPKVRRQFLHAYALSFYHPNTRRLVHFEAELPEDMREFLGYLRA